MKKHIFALVVAMASLLAGCVGPLVNHETARTVGDGNHELMGGYGNAGFVFKWNYGVSKNFDLGLQWESLSLGIRGKYAFINNEKGGWSWAGAAGIGTSIGGSHYYGDLIGSYLVGKWEPYGTLRIVHVTIDPVEFKDKDTGKVNFTVNLGSYDYGQFMLGSRYWFTEHWLLSLEASTLFGVTRGVEFTDSLFIGAAGGYRF